MTKIAVVGATGLVGKTFLEETQRLGLHFDELELFASPNSQGKTITVGNKGYKVKSLKEGCFVGVDTAFFCAGSQVSQRYALKAVEQGARVIDNSSFFRRDKNIPLVAVEVNFFDIKSSPIIANPNCSTLTVISALNALKPLGLKSVNLVTFQSASGCGQKGLLGLSGGAEESKKIFGADLKQSCIPFIGNLREDGQTEEEEKMRFETKKILHLPRLKVFSTCVRVPIAYCHAVSVTVELQKSFNIDDIFQLFKNQSGLLLKEQGQLPLGEEIRGSELAVVGRIRKNLDKKNSLSFFCVADNLYKGASSNALLIAKKLGQDKEK